MKGINTPADRVRELISFAKNKTSISHMVNENGNEATWYDNVWIYKDSRSEPLNIYFVKSFPVGGNVTSALSRDPITEPLKQILMLYCLDILKKNTSLANMRNYCSRARLLLEKVESIESITDDVLESLSASKSFSFRNSLNRFVRWLNNKNVLDIKLNVLKLDQPSLTGDEIDQANQEKLPDDKVLLALGAIHHDVIPIKEDSWKIAPKYSQKDSFIMTMVAFALASPNRASSEQTILGSQELKSITINDNKDTSGHKTIHYLDWKGSKGYKNSENHILANMANAIEISLKYIQKATEPMRVLCRFYKNPKLPLKNLLLDFKTCEERMKRANADLDKTTNILKLAYILEIFDEKHLVQVPRGTTGGFQQNIRSYNSRWLKSVFTMEIDDTLVITKESLVLLLGIDTASTTNRLYNDLGLKGQVTVEAFQHAWISLVKKAHPNFPKLTHSGKNGTCDARYMMFAFSGYQLEVKSGSNSVGLHTKLMPLAPKTLGHVFSESLKNKRENSIFLRHGFSEKFEIRPHQFRHFLNHNASESGLPKIIVNMWSKRKDPTQIVHYVHTSGKDKAQAISDILLNEAISSPTDLKDKIKVVSQQEYERLTGDVAAETSSGICTQSLSVNPCNYLNDFETQCVLCESSCHIAHDYEALQLLESDLKIQNARLEKVSTHPRFKVSQAMQKWFKLHSNNKEAIAELIKLMSSPDIIKGSLIRVLANKLEFRITDIKTKNVSKRKLQLPDMDAKIQSLIDDGKTSQSQNSVIYELLEMI